MKKLSGKFYGRSTIKVAIDLLGCRLISNIDGFKTGGIIVETEAYIGENDPACHAFRGLTKRNRVMYGPPGFLYVYFTYGNHYMANVVTEKDGFPAAVLLRGLEPWYNIDIMSERRGISNAVNISSGPGKLTRALGLTTDHNGLRLDGKLVYISGPSNNNMRIYASPRIGIGQGGKEKLWRFFLRDSPHVSRGSSFVRGNTHTLNKAGRMGFSIGRKLDID
jgi:DNA-3-methyladenine glycosylase